LATNLQKYLITANVFGKINSQNKVFTTNATVTKRLFFFRFYMFLQTFMNKEWRSLVFFPYFCSQQTNNKQF